MLLLCAGGFILRVIDAPIAHKLPTKPVKLFMPTYDVMPPLSDTGSTGAAILGRTKPPSTRDVASSLDRPGRTTPGPVADPDPALLEPYPVASGFTLPRIAADGRRPMGAYAAGFDSSSLRPRVGILISGIGMNEADSLAAIKNLPGAVTLAISPYAGDLARLLSIARLTEHEYLLSIPMEPQGYPVNDPDDRDTMMTSLSSAENLDRLRRILGRISGYVGVTNALSQMRGERLASVADQFDVALRDFEHRGLLFFDVRVGEPLLMHVWNRAPDLVIDNDPVDRAVLDRRLDALTRLALDKGSALGFVSLPRPLTRERLVAWTNSLASKGVVLAPISALVLPPAKQDSEN